MSVIAFRIMPQGRKILTIGITVIWRQKICIDCNVLCRNVVAWRSPHPLRIVFHKGLYSCSRLIYDGFVCVYMLMEFPF